MRRAAIRCWLLAALTLAGPPPAAVAMDAMMREAVEVSRVLRQSTDIFDQIAGAGTLADVGDAEALRFLTDTMQGHRDWTLKRAALDTLLSVRNPAALGILRSYADLKMDPMFFRFLLQSLAGRPRADMTNLLVAALDLDDTSVKRNALQALVSLHPQAQMPQIRRIAEDNAQDGVIRAYAWFALMHSRDREAALDHLAAIATDGDPDAREIAAVGLGIVNNARSRAALEQLSASPDARVALAALASEAGFGIEASVTRLTDLIIHGTGLNPSAAAASLRRIAPGIAVRITNEVITCCRIPDDTGARLVEAWASIEADPEVVYAWGLAHQSEDIRLQSVWLVGQRGDSGSIDAIEPMLRDTSPAIRGMAAWAIVRTVGDPRANGLGDD